MRSLLFRRIFLIAAMALAIATGARSGLRADESEKKPYMTAQEMLALAEASKVQYVFDTVKSADKLPAYRHPAWPQKPLSRTPDPYVEVHPDGSRSLGRIQFSKETTEAMRKADVFFQKKQYLEALEIYREAAKADPKCHLLALDMGDCYLFSGNLPAAVEQYEKAIALNPADFHGYWYRASALLELKRQDEARHAYARALAMVPRYPEILKAIHARSDRLGIDVREAIFHPKAAAQQKGDKFIVSTVVEKPPRPYWLVYGLCRAIWMAEEDHRLAMTNHREHNWTNTEDLECTGNLLAMYDAMKEDGKVPADPELDLLYGALMDRQLDAFVGYEFGSQATPDYALYLDDAQQERMADFVEKYVFQPK
jgi:tetratricopeptide (TPR) repeat protein